MDNKNNIVTNTNTSIYNIKLVIKVTHFPSFTQTHNMAALDVISHQPNRVDHMTISHAIACLITHLFCVTDIDESFNLKSAFATGMKCFLETV